MSSYLIVDNSQLPYLAYELRKLYEKADRLGRFGASTTTAWLPHWLYDEICLVWKKIKAIDPNWRCDQ